MTNSIKGDVISSIVSIGYYWVGEQNQQAAESIVGLLEQLEISGPITKKVLDLTSDVRTFFHLPADYKIPHHVAIPDGTSYKQYLWAAGVCIMNLFKAGDFELAYTMLMDMSLNWNELYRMVLETLKKDATLKNEVGMWLMTHFYMAYDLLGKDEMKMMGYNVIKDDSAD